MSTIINSLELLTSIANTISCVWGNFIHHTDNQLVYKKHGPHLTAKNPLYRPNSQSWHLFTLFDFGHMPWDMKIK